jgi:defect-in-organelle-trafficking protein DotC
MQDVKPENSGSDKKDSKEDKLRRPALRDAALSYGAKGGLAWASRQINRILESRAGELSRIYDFNRFIIREGGTTVLPPVIVEARDNYEQQDAGRTLRVADRYYRIIAQARFAPVAPLWHSYLIMSFSPPGKPEDSLLPKDNERELWQKSVAEGWDHGVQQAIDTYRLNLRRLNRDYLGMIRYSELLEKNMVSPPIVASENLGVTGTGLDMRQNDQVFRITSDPRLNVEHPSTYHAPVSDETPVEAATPPGETPGIDAQNRIEDEAK